MDADGGDVDMSTGAAAGAGAGAGAGGVDVMCLSDWDESGYAAMLDEQARAASAVLRGCCFSVDGRHLSAVSSFGYVHTWEVEPHKQSVLNKAPRPVASVAAHSGTAHCCCIAESASGSVLITGGASTMKVWKLDDLLASGAGGGAAREPTACLVMRNPREEGAGGAMPPFSATRDVIVDAKAPRAFSAAGDGYAYAWDLSTGKCTAKFKGHTDCVNSIIFMDTHNAIATASRDGSVRVWDTRSAECSRVFTPVASGSSASASPKWLGAVASDTTNSWLACGGESGVVDLFHMTSGDSMRSFSAGAGIRSLCYHEDTLMVGTQDPHLQVFSAFTGKLLQRVVTSSSLVYDVEATQRAGKSVFAACGGSSFVDVLVEPSSIAYSLTVLADGSGV